MYTISLVLLDPAESRDSPFPHSQLDEPQSLLQRQIVRPRMSRQTLSRTTDDDGDTIPWTFTEDV
jgi:hypothetical protein